MPEKGTGIYVIRQETGEGLCRRVHHPYSLLPGDRFFLSYENTAILYTDYLTCVHSETGEKLWSVFLQNGCAFYDIWKDHAYVGDFGKTVKKISLQDGTVAQEAYVRGQVVGQHKISHGSLYTVLRANEGKPIRLIKLSLS